MIDEVRLIEDIHAYFRKKIDADETEIIDHDILTLNKEICKIVHEQHKANEWIPVSEKLPKSEDKYGWVKCNVTVMRSHWPASSYDVCDSPYDEYFVTDAMYDVSQKIWHIGDMCQLNALIDIEDSPLNGDYVIAWMPLPEPYKGD